MLTGIKTLLSSRYAMLQVGDLAQLDESEAPKAGYARVYLVPMRADATADAQPNDAATAEAVLQVW
jgi:hypothetical protein